MSQLTYNRLVLELSSYLERNDEQFLGMIPTFIRNAEIRITTGLKELTTQELVRGQLGRSSTYFLKPALWRGTVSVGLIRNNGSIKRLWPRTFEFCRGVYPDAEYIGEPEYYADAALEYIFVAPKPDATYQYELMYQSAVMPLALANQENKITKQYPNLLLYGCLLEALMWTQTDERLPIMQTQFDNALAAAQNEQQLREVNRPITGAT